MRAALKSGYCRLRLRPIVMTSVAFIAGTIPLVLSGGAGAEVRSATGVTVFAGMIGVTLFGLFLTPVFYVGLRKLSGRELIQHGEARADKRAGGPEYRGRSGPCRRLIRAPTTGAPDAQDYPTFRMSRASSSYGAHCHLTVMRG